MKSIHESAGVGDKFLPWYAGEELAIMERESLEQQSKEKATITKTTAQLDPQLKAFIAMCAHLR